jgi:hypothetical protein
LEQKNKMADKIKMKLRNFLSKSIKTWDLERTSYKENIVEVTFFQNFK